MPKKYEITEKRLRNAASVVAGTILSRLHVPVFAGAAQGTVSLESVDDILTFWPPLTRKIAREIIAKSPDNVAKYRSGNEGVCKFFVGQVMRETRGQANPQMVNEIVKRVLSE